MSDLKYIEQKSGHSDDGPAWIGKVKTSRNKKTIYFNGKAFRKGGGQTISGNHYDIENGDEYWISGIKKSGKDGWGESMPGVMIDEAAIEEYLSVRGLSVLPGRFIVFTPKETSIEKFSKLDNMKLKRNSQL